MRARCPIPAVAPRSTRRALTTERRGRERGKFKSSLVTSVQGCTIGGFSPSGRRRLAEAPGCLAAGDGGSGGKAKVRGSALLFLLHTFAPVLPSFLRASKPSCSQCILHVVFRCSKEILVSRHNDEALFIAFLLISGSYRCKLQIQVRC